MAGKILSKQFAVATIVAGLMSPAAMRGQSATKAQFEVASVKPCGGGDSGGGGARGGKGGGGDGQGPSPDRLTMACQPLRNLVRMAYLIYATGNFNPMIRTPIEGGPAWVDSDRYQITAKAEGTPGQGVMRGAMLRALLEDRFKLKIRRETREVPVYNLTIGKNGPKLTASQEGSCMTLDFTKPPPPPSEAKLICGMRAYRRGINSPDRWEVAGGTLDEFAGALSIDMDRTVINKTAIADKFDFHLEFTRDETTPFIITMRKQIEERGDQPATASDAPGGLSIFTAIQQQLGLKLEPAKGPREFLVIDHAERPAEN